MSKESFTNVHSLTSPDSSISSSHGKSAPPANLAGLQSSFDDLYACYRPLLRRIAVRKFAIPVEDVDGLVHDVFATYLTHSERVREIHPYLIGGICNAARQYWRQNHAEQSVVCRDDHTRAVHDPAIAAIFRNLLLSSVLAKLGASCRETLQQFYIAGESAIGIAASRNTTQNSILRLLNYCRSRAREAYRGLSERRSHA
jgi:RNA polymerase sigma factor (sigma-70 family)